MYIKNISTDEIWIAEEVNGNAIKPVILRPGDRIEITARPYFAQTPVGLVAEGDGAVTLFWEE